MFGVARPLLVDALPYANASNVGMFWMSGWWNEEEFLYMRDKFAGFQAVGVMRRYERDVDGTGWHDGLLMELIAREGDH